MARARNIKPGFCENEHLAELPFDTRLTFALLPMFADREGRLEDRPKRLRMQMFPADNLDMDRVLSELHNSGFIERYAVGNERYIQIVNFSKHQKPHPNEKSSDIPAATSQGEKRVAPRLEVSNPKQPSAPADLLNEDSLNEDCLKEQSASRKRSAEKRGARLPEGWRPPDDLIAWAMTEAPGIDIQRVIDSFTDYWRAQPGAKGRKSDWPATFRNWVRRENERSGKGARGGGAHETPVQRAERKEREALGLGPGPPA